VRCPQPAAVRRSEGEVGTGLGAQGAPRPCPPAPTLSARVREGDAQALRAWPIRAGAIGGGGRGGGQAVGSAAGEGVGGLLQTPFVLRRCHHCKRLLCGASSEKARGDQGVAGCSAVGGLLQTDDGLHTDGDGGQSVRDNPSRGRTSERSGPKAVHAHAAWRAGAMGGGSTASFRCRRICLMTLPCVIAAMIRSVPC
jgi:hypothetical protein